MGIIENIQPWKKKQSSEERSRLREEVQREHKKPPKPQSWYKRLRKKIPAPAKAPERFISRLKDKKFSQGSVKLARFVTGSRIAMPVRAKGYGVGTRGSRIGRPRGPSGKYYIPKRGAVGVYEWRRWARNQRAMQRMRLAQQMAQYQNYPQRYAQQQRYQQMPQQYPSQAPRQQIMPQPIQNYPQQRPPETQGVSLMNGWDLLKIGSPSFQPSPPPAINPNKGAQIFNSELPITNPRGDYYTEPDLFTGRQILKRRFRDRSFQN